jgi:hypothetical protein
MTRDPCEPQTCNYCGHDHSEEPAVKIPDEPDAADPWLDEAATTLEALDARCALDFEQTQASPPAAVLAARASAEATFALALLVRQLVAQVRRLADDRPAPVLYEGEPEPEPPAEEGEP